MWKAWTIGRPVMVVTRQAGLAHRKLADTTQHRPQMAAIAKDIRQPDLDPSTQVAPVYKVMDGNEAAASVAYMMSDISFIYPISPATSMGEMMDKWASSGRKNILGQVVDINMMQSEAGAAGALHGAAAAGTLTSTFTASQGLLLMIPNMYLLAGELVPTVLHVSARTVSKHALSIFNDHSDVMAVRQTGFAMLCSDSVQQVQDLGVVAHVASLKSRLPFLHFFDGYRTSAEVSKIKMISETDVAKIFPYEKIQEHLVKYSLNPNSPIIRGTGQRPDIFFQGTVAANKYYQEAPDIVQQTMNDLAKITGRQYKLFGYHGSPTAERVTICMASASQTLAETVDYLNNRGENVGVLNCHLFRPWSMKHFMAALPPTVKKIAVLDKTREDGASGMPLFLDVNVTMSEAKRPCLITGATYGLASKEFTPAMAEAVYANLDAKEPMMRYVIGIEDDVTKTSLPYGKPISTVPEGTTQCLFWGLGSDGTVGASKTNVKILGGNTDLKAQGHFVFDSHKAEGITISHLRFSPEEIKSEYSIQSNADYVSCSHPSYVYKYQMLEPLKDGGIFVLNSPWSNLEEMEKKLPANVKNDMARKKIQFYNIDATRIAREVGLGKRINMIMQTAFYNLSGVLPVEQAINLLNESVKTQYKHKGPKVIDMNHNAIKVTMDNLVKIEYPDSWLTEEKGGSRFSSVANARPEFVKDIMDPVVAMEGDRLPVSAFEPGGYQPIGTTIFEKRGIAPAIPVWKPDKCTQCNYCAIVCPHAVIRPFLLDKNETKCAPKGYEARKAKGGQEVAGLNYTIQISPFDCTGCEVCVESCPDDALEMFPYNEVAEAQAPHWDYSISLPERTEIGDKYSVKGSQFEKPLLEFSGACAGCGETPYLKLATQLFGERMVIANASGCSSVWGGTSTTIPFAKNADGRGPAWGRSLFEDNAEYGFGMMLATKQRRLKLMDAVKSCLVLGEINEEFRVALETWMKYDGNPDKTKEASMVLEGLFKKMPLDQMDVFVRDVFDQQDMLRMQSHWLVGGDGWAYDIGYGGLDHVISRNENINILVLDTEMYSNTGGQVSKATQLSTVTKFASLGKRQNKKDLGLCAMQYENIYVSSVAMGANMNQCNLAFKEAEAYPGTSLIIAFAPCIDWGIEMKYMMDSMKDAVDTGYWTLYRYDPQRIEKGLNPFQLDSKKIKKDLQHYLSKQNRFEQLTRQDSETSHMLHDQLNVLAEGRREKYRKLSMDDYEMLEHLKSRLGEVVSSDKVVILYGSETGNAENLAGIFASEFKRRNVRAKCMSMDDFDVEELPSASQVFCVVATCGQGELPGNCKDFFKSLSDPALPNDFLKDTKFAVFGLGDSSYVFFNEAAKKFQSRFQELGGQEIMDAGMADDKDEDRFETRWNEWAPELWQELGSDPPVQELLDPSYNVTIAAAGTAGVPDLIVPSGAKLIPMEKNVLLTPEGYDRDIRHYEMDLKGTGFENYSVGDCLGVFAHNETPRVSQFLDEYDLSPETVIQFEDTQDRKNVLAPMMTARQLFTEVLDVFGKPNRRFYETLAMASKDEAEKAAIEHLLSKEGKDDLKQLANTEYASYADLLKKFPSSKLALEYLVDYIPRIKPRLYSIASSSEMHPGKVELCVIKEDWNLPDGELRNGLCSNYLINVKEGGQLAGNMNAAGINWPDSHAAPCIMVGLGTGIAPLRAMVEEREVKRMEGETVGPMALFFGARNKHAEYSYGDEFEEYHSGGKGVLTHISNAFSRDQEHKIYVQHRIAECPELIYDYLHTKKGYFYLCGPAGNVPAAVRKGVVDAYVKCGGFSEEVADKMVTDLQIEGRYNIEAW